MSKYLIVLLQERCEKIQFKSGHPVVSNLKQNKATLCNIKQLAVTDLQYFAGLFTHIFGSLTTYKWIT